MFALLLVSVSNEYIFLFKFQITQYSCDYNNLAPEGCTQYFFGDKSTSGVVKTFNFDTGTHLADQNQNICVRRERGICK